ncbi:hypothetical protein [Conexibacter sp. CPCC 206217]|uniref:hypothetical protein n=1 Tax=Conexibacter sp. CPCC 206217 TaxID=3064574 RepID=UPI002715D1EA|nr:hypothetical protein [Conexibacter sp. CPCC 206217]MDO8213820.1 hypothetical protein [Conexibacter sp. CPCC 206217]
MAQQRRRKRGSGSAGAATGGLADTPALVEDAKPRRARAGSPAAAPPATADGALQDAPVAGERRPSRTERRNAEARAALVPLAEGERPGAVTVAAIVSVVLAALVLIGYFSGARVGGEGSLGGALLLSAILLLAAWGMWTVRYWAVLGFEALLAFQIVIASLSLAVASNWWAALLCVALIGLGGWLFWKLIRAMARIQMPERRPAA